VNYTVTANTSTSSRTGTITVGGQTFTVTQGGTSGGGTTTGNLIQNGDAESGPAAANAASVPSIPGWTTDGGAAVVAYTDTSGDLTVNSPRPPNPGNNYFAGGTNNTSATMTQTINLSSYAAAIDTGTQPYTLDGWLGGWDGQDDNAVLTVTFLSASGGTLGTASIGPVLSADRNGADGLLERTTSGTVPSGTRSALISLVFTRTSGTYDDGCADNLYFGLNGGGGGTTTLTVTLTPATATNPTGTQHTVTAKVADANNVPQTNVTVTFTVLSGPNAGATGVCSPSTCKTDANGQVTFTYTGSGGAGQDSIKACVSTTATGQACCSTPLNAMATAQPAAAKSGKVVIIGAANVDPNCSSGANVVYNGGCLPITGNAGELGDFTFAGLAPANVTAANLAQYDTALLNVSSSGMACDTSKLSTQAKTDLVAFVAAGKKLLIHDSECQGSGSNGLDYSWLPYPFTTANPGAMGAQGTANIVENSSLISSVTGSASFVDARDLSQNAEVGDMNVMTTKDSHWCLAMSGTNALKVTGPVLAYAKYPAGTDTGLFIYNGLDHDMMGNSGNANLRKIWVLELQQPFNPSNLPCGVAVVGIVASPTTATNQVGTTHTVTSKVADQLGAAQANVTVTFSVTGTNASATGTCNPSTCKTDSTGQVTFTYTGSKGVGQDTITACFTPAGGTTPVCAAPVTKTWVNQPTTTQTCSPVVTKTWTSGGGTCTYTFNPTSLSVAATQSTGVTIAVTAGSGCSWTVVNTVSWITVTSATSGTGNGSVTISVAANTGASRSGTFTIAGQTYTVSQASGASSGCSYNVSPTDIHATAAGLSNTVLIFTNTGCTWTASVPSGVTWITLSPTSGSGGGGVGYSIAANTGAARSTTITVAGVAVTVEQDASCTYTLSATSSPLISGVGGVGSVAVTVAGTNCAAWNVATPSVSWVHVAGGSGSTSSGSVSYSVDSNTAASRRSTTLTVANQSYSVQQDAAPCTYALSPASSGTLAAGGASGSFHVTAAGPACTWSITVPSDPNLQWTHVISALNAMSSGDVSYTVDPNNTTSARSLALTMNGKNPATTLTYTVNQAPGAANTAPGPIVNPNGIVNAASFISANLPAGSIAQGSFFSIFGNGLGPANPGLHATSYPLGTNLGGVSVKVTQGSTSVDAIPLFVAQYQINAVMPSNTPTGTVQVTVSYSGATSAPVPVQIVAANFGAFTVSGGHGPGIVQNYVSATQNPLNMTSLTAAPGDYVILWGTGLGPLPGGASDALPPAAGSLPASVQVLLGNLTISPSYAGRAPGLAGVDQVDFQLPSNVTLGCYVPLQVVVNGNASNTVTMAINNNRQPCSDTSPFSATSRSGGKNASMALARLSYTDPLNALKIGNGTVDIAMGTFNQSPGVGDLGFSLFASLPPLNTCTYYNNVGSLNGLLGGQMPSSANAATPLDAGPTITVQGPNGTQGVSYSDSSAQVSPYMGVLGTGGGWTALGLGPSTPFLDTGTYTVSGRGGKDVGPFQYTIQIPYGATWTNRDSITAVDRTKGLTIRWSGGNPSTQAVAIFGFSSNPASNVSGGFACLSDMAPQSFTVPSSFLANLPATPATNPGNAISALVFATVPTADQFVKFSTSAPPSLDSGLGYYAVGELRNSVVFQ
jgi:uncharacterized protein (TIGR03437 family)